MKTVVSYPLSAPTQRVAYKGPATPIALVVSGSDVQIVAEVEKGWDDPPPSRYYDLCNPTPVMHIIDYTVIEDGGVVGRDLTYLGSYKHFTGKLNHVYYWTNQ